MRRSKTWDLYEDAVPGSGAWNMAVDEYLFLSLDESAATKLRFYMWDRPTISLGYSQKAEDVIDLELCRREGIDIVRRLTGGKVVLHHREITYSICSADTSLFSPTVFGSYRKISEALILGLKKMGLNPRLADSPPESYTRGHLPCFSHPARNEIEIEGKKIIGSAQKRIGDHFLQHGSLPLEDHEDLLRSVTHLERKAEPIRMISLSSALGGKHLTFDEAVPLLRAGFAEFFQVDPVCRMFDEGERQAILRLEHERYESQAWTLGAH